MQKRNITNHWRRHIHSAVFFIFVTVICVVALELSLRFLYPMGASQVNWWVNKVDYTYDKDLIYSGVKNTTYTNSSPEYSEKVSTNTYGYRDYEFKKKKPGSYRILAVGDSFTFGLGIETNDKTYPKLLEKYLKTRPELKNKDIEVFNIAAKGYSPDQEYRQIQKEVSILEPDMILWNFSLPGDMYNLLHEGKWPIPSLYDVDENKLVPLDARFNWLYIAKYIKTHSPSFVGTSHIFNLLTYRISQVRFTSRKPYMSNKDMTPWIAKKIHLEIRDIQKLAEKKNMQLVIVSLPYPEQFNMSTQSRSLTLAYQSIIQSAQQSGTVVIDMKDSIVKKKPHSWSDLYFKIDYHPNQKGAAFFAETVGDRISRLIPLD